MRPLGWLLLGGVLGAAAAAIFIRRRTMTVEVEKIVEVEKVVEKPVSTLAIIDERMRKSKDPETQELYRMFEELDRQEEMRREGLSSMERYLEDYEELVELRDSWIRNGIWGDWDYLKDMVMFKRMIEFGMVDPNNLDASLVSDEGGDDEEEAADQE